VAVTKAQAQAETKNQLEKEIKPLSEVFLDTISTLKFNTLNLRETLKSIMKSYSFYSTEENAQAVKHLGNVIAELKRANFYIVKNQKTQRAKVPSVPNQKLKNV
jgi:hexokinase